MTDKNITNVRHDVLLARLERVIEAATTLRSQFGDGPHCEHLATISGQAAIVKLRLAAPAEGGQGGEECFCDRTGLGVKGVSCGDCPRDYTNPPAASVTFTEQHGKDLRSFADQFNDPAVTETSITRAQWDAIAAFVRAQDAIIDSHEESASVGVEGWTLKVKADRDGEIGVWAVKDDVSIWIDSAGGAKENNNGA